MKNLQVELPMLGNIKREQEVLSTHQEYLLDDLEDHTQAILFSMHYARRNQTVVGEELGKTKSHWSGIVNGNKNMSWPLKEKFMDLVGNDILLQWFAWKRGYRLVKREPTKEERLALENEQLRAQVDELKKQSNG